MHLNCCAFLSFLLYTPSFPFLTGNELIIIIISREDLHIPGLSVLITANKSLSNPEILQSSRKFNLTLLLSNLIYDFLDLAALRNATVKLFQLPFPERIAQATLETVDLLAECDSNNIPHPTFVITHP